MLVINTRTVTADTIYVRIRIGAIDQHRYIHDAATIFESSSADAITTTDQYAPAKIVASPMIEKYPPTAVNNKPITKTR